MKKVFRSLFVYMIIMGVLSGGLIYLESKPARAESKPCIPLETFTVGRWQRSYGSMDFQYRFDDDGYGSNLMSGSYSKAPSYSYLTENENTYVRIEIFGRKYYMNGTRIGVYLEDDLILHHENKREPELYVEEINKESGECVNIIRHKLATVKPENESIPDMTDPLFGGLYLGDRYYFLMIGQKNPEEDNNKEVIRIIKFNKSWEPIGVTSVYGNNTVLPFRSGTSSFAESGDFVYINTCHLMYKSDDGLCHQANMHISFNQETMQLMFVGSGMDHYGYASHSFNQSVIADGEYLYSLDHGDAYPRGLNLCRYSIKSDGIWKTGIEKRNLFEFEGAIGTNQTYVKMGGLAISSTSCLTVFSQDREKNGLKGGVYILGIDRNNIKNGAVAIKCLEEGSTYGVPQIVNLKNDRFLVMWSNELKKKVHYVIVDKDGQLESEIKEVRAYLADCTPLLKDGCVKWYTTGDPQKKGEFKTIPTVYTIDTANGLFSETKWVFKKAKLNYVYDDDLRKKGYINGKATPGSTVCACLNYPSDAFDEQFTAWTETKCNKKGKFKLKFSDEIKEKLKHGRKRDFSFGEYNLILYSKKEGMLDGKYTVVEVY